MAPNVTHKKLIAIRNQILDAADTLLLQPMQGQEEPFLAHLGQNHRRLVIGHYKIIYRVIGEYIYKTDIFDLRQNPGKMKG